jgi:hypothetical protein
MAFGPRPAASFRRNDTMTAQGLAETKLGMSVFTPFLEAALAYARLGLAVFPCRGKVPAIPEAEGGHGCRDATTDFATIEGWWRGKYRHCNIGMATGGKVWALDVDTDDDGDVSLTRLEREHGPLPDTVRSITGGGGAHYLFIMNGTAIRNSVGKITGIAPGLDIRGDGGYIIVPPSIHPDTRRAYQWEADYGPEDLKPAEAPAWLEALAKQPEKPERIVQDGRLRTPAEGPASLYGQKALDDECRSIEVAGNRAQEATLNTAGLKIGSLVAGGELDEDHAFNALVAAALKMPNYDPRKPWRPRQIENKLRRSMFDGGKSPRSVPKRPPEPKAFRNGHASHQKRADEGESAKHAYAEALKGEDKPAGPPIIRVVAGELPRMVDEAEAVLVDTEAPIFQRGSMLVVVGESIIKTKRGDVKGPRMMPVSSPLLLEQLNRRIRFEKYDGRTDTWKAVNCPKAVAETYLARPRWDVLALMGIVEAPTLRWDGTVLNTPGYDKDMGLILLPGGPRPTIADRPTKDQAAAALKVLAEPLKEFPFVTNADRAVALSGILTAVSRRAYQFAPLHAFSAPVAGTGKGKLVDVAAMMMSGRPAPVIAPGKMEEETEKRLGAALIAGDPILSIDNVVHPLGSELLCQMLTQPLLKVRILGQSANFEAPSNMALFATGNNLEIAGDMTRRTLLCRLDPQCERPELREFDFDPVAQVAKDRARYIGAALTVLRAYIVAGYPDAPIRLGSFEEWSNTVRGALLWLGEDDPVNTMEAARESDPLLANQRMLMGAWADRIGHYEPMTAAKLIERSNQTGMQGDFANPDLREALLSIAGDGRAINSRRLGHWLKANSRRFVNGLRIMLVEENTVHGARYRLERRERGT